MILDESLNVVENEFSLGELLVSRQYTYDEANSYISHPENDPVINWKEYWELARELKKKRKGVVIEAANKHLGQPTGRFHGRNTPAHILVEELMILTNTVLSREFATREIPALFLNNEEPSARRYFATSTTGHAPIGARFYGHWTSPLRRYPDLVNNRILVSYIVGGPHPYTEEELNRIATITSDRDAVHRQIQRGREMQAKKQRRFPRRGAKVAFVA